MSHAFTRRRGAVLVLTPLLACLALSGGPSFAQAVPSVINYQARLTDNSPQQTPVDATLAIDFRIYGSPLGNDLLWSESWPATAVTDGLLSVLLGSNGSPLDVSIFADPGERYLEVEIDGEILAPRQRMGSVGYAMRSATASDVAIECQDGQVLKFTSGSWSCSDTTTCPVGSTVECYTGPAGTLGVGVCSVGTAECNGAGYGGCGGEVTPFAEICNGDDDNCDGATDETFPEMNMPCSAGVGACETQGFIVCPAGSLTCDAVPGDPSSETCNDIDDDCDGVTDNNIAGDAFEPNESCAATPFLGTLGSDQVANYSSLTLNPVGDQDHFRFTLNETDSSCGCGLSTDEDYRFHATLTVPASAGSYEVCVATTSCGAWTCTTVAGGAANGVFLNLDGACTTQDTYTGFVRVRGINSPAFECAPYTLQVRFEAGLCL